MPKNDRLRSKDAYDGRTKAPWNGSNYVEVKRLYRHLVHFQADCQAKMIGHVSDILTNIDSNLRLIVFPPSQGPSVWGMKEYTLDMSRNNLDEKQNIVWEMADWENQSGTGHITNLKDWAKQATDAAPTTSSLCSKESKTNQITTRTTSMSGSTG